MTWLNQLLAFPGLPTGLWSDKTKPAISPSYSPICPLSAPDARGVRAVQALQPCTIPPWGLTRHTICATATRSVPFNLNINRRILEFRLGLYSAGLLQAMFP
ncbi:hypothetical protein J6590_025074 [Homalodisca vitripennis]|nr:hypothetical protein J6590_025074 [Homalodisca vitripennis]